MRLDVYQHNGATPVPRHRPPARRRRRLRLPGRGGESRRAPEESPGGHPGLQEFPARRRGSPGAFWSCSRRTEEGDYGDYVRRTIAEENADRTAQMKAQADKEKRSLVDIQKEQGRIVGQSLFQRRVDRDRRKSGRLSVDTKARIGSILAGLLLALAASALAAGKSDVIELSYQSAIGRSLAKNFQIQVEEYNPKITTAQTLSAKGQFDPVASVSLTYDENRTSLRSLVPAADDGTPDTTNAGFDSSSGVAGSATISGLTPWGLNYSVRTLPHPDHGLPVRSRSDPIIPFSAARSPSLCCAASARMLRTSPRFAPRAPITPFRSSGCASASWT